jgi:phage shock protein A
MSVFKKLMTAIRGGATEIGESIVDANGIRIFEQEIRDAKEHIQTAKKDLTTVMAEQAAATRKVSTIKADIEKHEGYAMAAMEKGDESLALSVAEKISELEQDLSDAEEVVSTHSGAVERLKGLVKQSQRTIKDNERQLSMVKTTESVQKATAAASSSLSNSNGGLSSAKASLERIKARQQKTSDQMEAAQTLENGDNELESQLKAAGIGEKSSSANSVLERLKAKQAK